MESTPVIKKTRGPRVKKEFKEVITPIVPLNIQTVDVNALQTQVVNDLIHELKEHLPIKEKEDVIFCVDPGFTSLGHCVISTKTGEYINSWTTSLRPKSVKLTQAEVDAHISNNIQKIMNDILEQYNVTHFVVELQLGQFSVDKIQLAFILLLPDNIPYTVQHSKLKLQQKTFPELKDCTVPNPDSKQYSQNKHMGRVLAERLFVETRGRECSFDELDACLHAKYAFRNLNTIKWLKKQDVK